MITVFDTQPTMSPDNIFPKLTGSQFYCTCDFCKGYWAITMEEKSWFDEIQGNAIWNGELRFHI